MYSRVLTTRNKNISKQAIAAHVLLNIYMLHYKTAVEINSKQGKVYPGRGLIKECIFLVYWLMGL